MAFTSQIFTTLATTRRTHVQKGSFLYILSPKSVKKYGKYGWKIIYALR